MITVENFLHRIDELKKLEDGWYNGEGTRYNAGDIEMIGELFLNLYRETNVPLPYIYPAADSKIYIEWALGHPDESDIEIDPGSGDAIRYTNDFTDKIEFNIYTETHEIIDFTKNMKTVSVLERHKDTILHQLNMMRDICFGLSRDAGWHQNPNREPGTMIALMHSELSEALEGIRKDLMDDHLPHRKMVEVELADTIIRVLDFCGKYELDIGGALVEKLFYNTTRADHKLETRKQAGGKAF